MFLNGEDGLKHDVLLSRMKGLFKILSIERTFGCLFLYCFSFFYMRNVQMSLLTMLRTYNDGTWIILCSPVSMK